MRIRRLAIADPDPWMRALEERPDWLSARLPLDARSDRVLAERAERVCARHSDRERLAAALEAANRRWGADAATLASLGALRSPDAVVITTGQQVGALLGPLYTVYKAAGAVAHARRLQAALGRPVVPVFWAATEDHDVGEINRVRVPAPGGRRADFRLFDPVPAGRRPVGPLPVTEAMERLVAELTARELPTGACRREVLDGVVELAREHPTLGEHFCALLLRTFPGTGLVVLDPMDPELRRLGAQTMASFLERHDQVGAAVAAGMAAVAAAGHAPQVSWTPGETGLFALVEGERLMLEEREGRIMPRGRPDLVADRSEWAERVRRTPEGFSPSALLRPVLQEVLLPTLAVVLGPGELRYFAELGELFGVLGAQLPPVLPRPRLTLVDGSTRRLLERTGAGVEDLWQGWDERLAAELAVRDRVGIDARFAQFQDRLVEMHTALVAALAPLDASLAELGARNRDRILAEVAWLRSKAQHAHRQGNETLIRQYRTAAEHILPDGIPQERYYSALAYLTRVGWDLGARVARCDGLTQSGLLVADLADPG